MQKLKMALPSVYDPIVTSHFIERLNLLTPASQPKWGKMSVAQMLAHLNVAYDLAFGKSTANNGLFIRLLLRLVVKKYVTNEKPYPKNAKTAPVFLITDQRDFEREKNILEAYLHATQKKGSAWFEGRENASFGRLTAVEWNNMFYKHLDHHFTQFGV